ncbi:MAG: integrase domain-containing protein [Thauera sp.]|jgi:integrase|nr:integrase domain-containing protein [Thauera sp.]
MRATSLKGKHVEGLSAGTLKNRMEHLRWWAEKVGKAGILPADNTTLGIPERRYVTNESKAKGGRDRTVPITTPEQRTVLDEAHRLAGLGSLIPANKTYIQQRHVYDGQCKAAGLSNMHGLRHRYAQMRYEAQTGWRAPAAGGPSSVQLSADQRMSDQSARQQISRELGHERLEVTSIYLGT